MSIYSLATIGFPDNQIKFNDYDSGADVIYRSQTRAPRQFQVRQDDIPVPFESGVSDFKTLIGQTIYTIAGTMYPKNEQSYDEGLAAIRAVSSLDIEQRDPYGTDDGYVPYTWGEATGQKTLFVKVLYAQIVEDTRQGFVQPFLLYCKVKDPTIYGATLKTASTAESDPETSTGAAIYPFQYPIVYGSTLYSVSADANNVGNIAVYPFGINIYGPITNPKIINEKTGEFIQVNVTLNSQSDQLVINYDKDTLEVTLNGNSVINNVTTDSTYFKIQPGDNNIVLQGATIGTGAVANVFYRDGWPLA